MSNRSPVAVDQDVCTGCGICVESCPTDVLRATGNGKVTARYPEDCQFCFLCVFDCAAQAISVTIPRLADDPKWWPHWVSIGSQF